MANEVRFTIKLNVDGQTKVVDATAAVDELTEAIGEVREASDTLALSKGWEGMMLGVNAAMDVIGKVKGAVEGLAGNFQSFETAMVQVNTMAGKDAEGLAGLTDQVSALSKEIPKAREELADGLYQTISNGVPEADWLTFLEQSAKASVGGIADLGETVKVTSTVIKNYGMEWSEAGSIQDKIQMTAKNGVTSFGELAAALPRVTANAATLGVSVDELLASFATLTGVSGNTAEVSTQLSAILSALVKPSSEAAKMAEAMGIQFDAAAIKAAGGMQQFLEKLDTSVKQYSKTSGMLEQEVYGTLFGSAESLRALIPLTGELKDKFVENVGQMGNAAGTINEAFGQVSSTGASTMQMLKNSVLSMLDPLGSLASSMLPVVEGLSSVGQAGLGLYGLTQSLAALRNAHVLTTAATIAHSSATKVLGTVSAATGVSVTALKTAVRGLMIATGVGAAIAALTFVVEKLAGASDKAAQSEKNLAHASESVKEAEEAGVQAAAAARTEIDREIKKLDELIKSKGDTRTAVQELNDKYGEWFGMCSTAQQWYDTLIKNSEAYCNQLAYEAQMRVYYEKKAALEVRRERNRQKQLELIENGKDQPGNPMGGFGKLRGVGATKYTPSEEMLALKTTEAELEKDIAEEEKNIQATKNLMTGNKPVDSGVVAPKGSGTGKANGNKTGKTGKVNTEVTYLEGSIGYIDKQIEALNKKRLTLVKEEDIKALDKVIERWKLLKEMKELAAASGKETPFSYMENALKFSTKDITEPLKNVIPKIKPIPIPFTANLTQVEKNLREIGKEKALKAKAAEAEKAQKKFDAATSAVTALGQGMSSIGKEIGLPVLDVLGVLAQAIATMVRGYAEASVQAEEIGGPWGWLAFSALGLGQLATMISTVKSMAAFADGGIVSGPTVGLVGEYAGARHNPEVISPLDKLRKLLADIVQPVEVNVNLQNELMSGFGLGQSIGNNAHGTFAYGPALGIFGAYAGTRYAPEPSSLDKLLGDSQQDSKPMEVRVRIKERDLYGFGRKSDRYRGRT